MSRRCSLDNKNHDTETFVQVVRDQGPYKECVRQAQKAAMLKLCEALTAAAPVL